jgi:dodecin
VDGSARALPTIRQLKTGTTIDRDHEKESVGRHAEPVPARRRRHAPGSRRTDNSLRPDGCKRVEASGQGRNLRIARSYKGDVVSVYRVIDIVGTSTKSWEDAAATAVHTARQTLRDLRVAEVVEQDLHVAEDGEITYRTKLRLSFKYEEDRPAWASG